MKAAFEINKGPIDVLTMSESDVKDCIDLSELLDALESGFRDMELGRVQSPPRPEIIVPGKGFSLSMMSWRPGDNIAVKVVNVFDGNLELALPNHLAMIFLFDEQTGATKCVMDGTYITGVRTAASAVLSARLIARDDASVATVIGAGVQGREHLRLLPLIRNLTHINVCSLHDEEAERLARQYPLARPMSDTESAVRESDIVCLATHSATPVIEAAWVNPGAHVTSVGYFPPDGELPPELARENRLFVETLGRFSSLLQWGAASYPASTYQKGTTLGAVIAGNDTGRRRSRRDHSVQSDGDSDGRHDCRQPRI